MLERRFINLQQNKDMPDPAAPIIVTGLPRSGTTFLFDILCNDEDHRSPLYCCLLYTSDAADED